MESQQFIEEGRKYVSSSSDEALPGSVSEKVHLTNSNFDVSRRSRRRAVLKDGYTNTFNSNVPLAGLTSITQDFFTFMMECRWRTLLLLFFTSFVISWLIFAVLYWAVAFGRGDLRGYEEFHDPTKEPCVTMMDDFISCFLFSMETQYSSGYGTRSPTTECPEAVFLVGFQSIFGALLQLSMSGIIFAKFARPKMRHQAIMFSHKAVISLRDRNLCLMFRVGDCRKSRLLGATLYARLLQHRVSAEGEKLPHYQHALKLSVDSSGSNIFLLWPLTAVHRIDSTSPLYDISADDLASASFELFVVLSGTVETMGQDTEARTSYTASEILWGHRLVPLVKTCGRGYILDYSRFHTTVPVDTPRCSARQLFSWTHNYVLLNKDGLLGNKDGYLDKDRFLNKDRFSDKDRFLENKDQFLENRDQFLENRDQFLDNKDRFSDNKDQFLEKDRFLENKDQFLDNKDQFLDNMDRLLSKRDIFFKDKDDGLLDNKDQVLSNKDELLVKKNQFMGNMDGMLDKKDQVLGNNDGILGTNAPFSSKTDEEQFLGNNDRFLSNNDRFLNSKEELLDNKGKCLGKENERLSNMDDFFNKDELLSNKDEFFDSKDQFLSNNDRLLSTKDQFMGKDGSFDSKDESLSNKDRLLGKDPPREEPHLKDGHFLGAEYREENETAENLSNLSGPVRKLSKIQKECPKKELHHSLMSLHDRKQQRGLSTLSEDNLR